MLKHYSFFPVNPRAVEQFGGMTERQNRWSTVENYVGNGPFRLAQWTTNQIIRTEKNPEYWDADRVQLNAIHFFPIENVNSEETAFRAGRLHMTSTVSPDRIPSFRETIPDQLRIDPYLGTYFFRLNVTRAPLNDPRVREALNLAVDRQLLVDRVAQGGQRRRAASLRTGSTIIRKWIVSGSIPSGRGSFWRKRASRAGAASRRRKS
jgi:oligopeptide transport system substrate-binding protein